MFNCPDNYEEFLKEEKEWYQRIEIEHREYALKNYPILCAFFNLPIDFTEEELEKTYREMRLNTHPDRPNGNKEKFMKAFEVYNELKSLHKYYKEITQR
ncbi:hypothetical protein HDR70_01285 [bacterium]|nr:hypothetical protein [Bacteroides sp.]MBD5386508.1 hypothetical protein [bacterium]